eukprot:UN06684
MAQQRDEGVNTAEDDAKLLEYSWEEIRKHNTEEDLWVVIYDRVYDVTEFQIDHPGGPDVLQDVAGTDATEEFENILHTQKARKMAKKFLIGKVEGGKPGNLFAEIEKDVNKNNDSKNDDGAGFMNTVITLGFLGLAGILAYNFYIRDK